MTSPPTLLPAGKPLSDLRSLSPWYIAVVLHSYAVTLYQVAIFDFADKQLALSSATRLWIMAFWGFAYIFIALLSGKLTTKWGSPKTLFIMFPLCAASEFLSLLIFLAPTNAWGGVTPFLLVALMLPVNFASTMCWPALETAVSQSPGKMPLATRMSAYNLCWSITGFVAIFSRGTLEHAWWPLIFIVPAAVTLLTSLLLFKYAIPASLLTQHHLRPDPDPSEQIENQKSRIQNATTLLHMAWIGNALAYVALNVLLPVLYLVASAAWTQYYHADVPLTIAGFATSAWGFTRVIGFLLSMKCTFWHYKARWLVGSQLALALSFLVVLTVHQPLILILAQVVLGLSTALVYSSSLYYAMHTSEGSGEHAGFHEALIGMGICLGPTIGALAGAGSTLDLASQLTSLHRTAYAVTALLLLGTLAMAALALRRPK